MPLHDWAKMEGWNEIHQYWIVALSDHLRERLPPGYRVYVGTTPVAAAGVSRVPDPEGHPDLSVRRWDVPPGQPTDPSGFARPDLETTVAVLETELAAFVEHRGRIVAVAELVSPGNKDRPARRDLYAGRYRGYLMNGTNLLLVDVHARPGGFSFHDRIATDLGLTTAAMPSPQAVSFCVGDIGPTGGRELSLWRRPLTVGQALPVLPLPLQPNLAVPVELEPTYAASCRRAYIA
jgi:hypothetical protein